MALTSDEKKLLNPTAPEFRPLSKPNLSIIPTPPPLSPPPPPPVATGFPLPPPPSPPPYAYYPQPQLPVMVYYHQHYHHILPSPQLLSPYKHAQLLLPPADDGLGLITSPTSPHSPPTPLPKTTRRARGPSRPGPGPGRFHKRFAPGSASSSPSMKWVKKKSELSTTTNTTEDVEGDPTPISHYPYKDCTSLMIRNIPSRLRRYELMRLLDDHCRMQNDKLVLSSSSPYEPFSQFDFLYLPIDFRRKGNKGYAFVNFTSWQGASRLYNSWKGTKWENCAYKSDKICQIDPAKLQGKELEEHFKRSKFECETDEYLPVKLSPPRDGSFGKTTQVTTLGRRVQVYGSLMDSTNQLTLT